MTAALRLQRVDVPALLRLIQRRAGDTRPALKAAVQLWRDDIDDEFAREEWHPRSGAPRPWEPVRPFPGQEPGKILSRSGRLRQSWAGFGPGSITRMTAGRAEFGVSGSVLPYAATHRGGAGKVTAALARRPAEIKVTPRMRRYLAAARSVYLRRSTRVIRIPRRPHATLSPRVRTGISAIFVRHLLVPGRIQEGAA